MFWDLARSSIDKKISITFRAVKGDAASLKKVETLWKPLRHVPRSLIFPRKIYVFFFDEIETWYTP